MILTTLFNFLSGIASVDVGYDVVRTLSYGFDFKTLPLSDILANLFDVFNLAK